MLKKTAIIIFMTLIFLLLGEVVLRIYRSQQKAVFASQLDNWEIGDENVGWVPRPGFTYQAAHINSLSFRGDEITLEKPDGITRIVSIGDSTTFGVLDQLSYPERLNNRLQECHYQVINAGVEAYNSFYALNRFQYDILPLDPDIVTVTIGWNDLYSIDPARPELVLDRNSWLSQLAEASELIRTAISIGVRIRPLETANRDTITVFEAYYPQQFYNNLNEIVDLAQDEEIQIILVTLPSILQASDLDNYLDIIHYPHFTNSPQLLEILWQTHNDVIQQVGLERNVSIIDLNSEFQNNPESSDYFFDTLHFHGEGVEFTTEVFLAAMTNLDLINCP